MIISLTLPEPSHGSLTFSLSNTQHSILQLLMCVQTPEEPKFFSKQDLNTKKEPLRFWGLQGPLELFNNACRNSQSLVRDLYLPYSFFKSPFPTIYGILIQLFSFNIFWNSNITRLISHPFPCFHALILTPSFSPLFLCLCVVCFCLSILDRFPNQILRGWNHIILLK